MPFLKNPKIFEFYVLIPNLIAFKISNHFPFFLEKTLTLSDKSDTKKKDIRS